MATIDIQEGVRDPRKTPCFARAAMSIAWPSFLAATAMTGVFFSFFDPQDMLVFGAPIELGRRETYGLGFMAFWGFSALASAMTYVLARPPRSDPEAK
ncbi:MAG: hypothetical protein ACO3WN_03755 [Burkholderiaceae bacterium]|jgi:hypothetical protein